MKKINEKRWTTAQRFEDDYWNRITIGELLRICSEKPKFLNLIGPKMANDMLYGKEVMEIGTGPLGISVASFYPKKKKIKRLVKVEPLEKKEIPEEMIKKEIWADPFLRWLNSLGNEGEYVQIPGESIRYKCIFDTVIIYNVLDHVKDPKIILNNAFNALKKNGIIVIGVDCRSALRKLKFDLITRRIHKGITIVEAHPHTFLISDVVSMMRNIGFKKIKVFGTPKAFGKLFGPGIRPAFIGIKKTVR